MNKSILLLIAFACMLSAMLFSCTGQVNNAKNDLENTNEENREIDQINQEYLKDIDHYRKETTKTIETNSMNIAALKANIDTEKEACKYHYRHSIFELELYNSYMKKKLDDYKPEGEKNWGIFKAEFIRQMDELCKEFTHFNKRI